MRHRASPRLSPASKGDRNHMTLAPRASVRLSTRSAQWYLSTDVARRRPLPRDHAEARQPRALRRAARREHAPRDGRSRDRTDRRLAWAAGRELARRIDLAGGARALV